MSGKNKPVLKIIILLAIPLLISTYFIVSRDASDNKSKISLSKPESIPEANSAKQESNASSSNIDINKATKRQLSDDKMSPEEPLEEKKANSASKQTEKKSSKSKPEPVNVKKRKTSKDTVVQCSVELQVNKGSGAKTYPVQMNCSGTVLDLLKTASAKYGFSLKYKNYSYGVFINEIDSLHDDESSSMYWLYYINGKLANLGASKQKITKGDVVLWKYEKAN